MRTYAHEQRKMQTFQTVPQHVNVGEFAPISHAVFVRQPNQKCRAR